MACEAEQYVLVFVLLRQDQLTEFPDEGNAMLLLGSGELVEHEVSVELHNDPEVQKVSEPKPVESNG